MIKTIGEMYITLLPAVFAGIFNMLWCTLPIASFLSYPLDNGKTLVDGNRIFGANKTWKGVVGMIGSSIIFMIIGGFLCKLFPILGSMNYFYRNYENTVFYNFIVGTLIGLAYIICELPNSFVKRRLGIAPGKPATGVLKVLTVFFDQADSLFGVVGIVALFYPISLVFYLLYVLLGAATHIVLNILLYLAKLRKNPF